MMASLVLSDHSDWNWHTLSRCLFYILSLLIEYRKVKSGAQWNRSDLQRLESGHPGGQIGQWNESRSASGLNGALLLRGGGSL